MRSIMLARFVFCVSSCTRGFKFLVSTSVPVLDLLRITHSIYISAPTAEPEIYMIDYVINLLNHVRPTNLKAVFVEIYP
ncbi:hypothetical protein V8D89_016262 [Ganoderma adspersum]